MLTCPRCFWINLPIAGTTFIILIFFLNVHNPRTPLRSGLSAIDWYGTASILGVMLMLLLGLDFGGVTFPWSSPTVICLIVFGVVMIAVLVVSETKIAEYPIIPISVFRNWSNVAAFAVTFCQGLVFIGGEFYLPLYFQSVRGAEPLRSGLLLIPLALSEAAAGCFSGLLIHQTGRYREMMWVGTILMTLGYGLFIMFDATTPIRDIIGIELIAGIGAGLLFQPPLVAVQVMVSQADTATATATVGTARNLATAISVVLGGIIFQNGMDSRISSLRAAGLNSTLISDFSDGHAAANVEVIKHIANAAQQRAVKDAFSWSLRNVWITYTVAAGLGFVVSVFVKHRDLSSEHTETRTGIEEMTKRPRVAPASDEAAAL